MSSKEPYTVPAGGAGLAPLPRVEAGQTPLRLGRPIIAGIIVFVGFFGLFGGWATFAPLDSAAIAPGVVKVEGERKRVQHLEGGIVGELAVRDGDFVRAGEILLRLDDTQSKARLELLKRRWATRTALAARLRSERDGLQAIEFPPQLSAELGAADLAAIERAQRNVFTARRRSIDGQTEILRRRQAQTREEVVGLGDEIAAQDRQIELIAAEVAGLERLFQRGLTPRDRLLGLQRRQAEIEGERARNQAAIARAQKSIAEIEQQIVELGTELLNQVVAELSMVEAELFDLEQQIQGARDVFQRMELRAPVDGVVVAMSVHTSGAVVRPGEVLMDIVPAQAGLVVEARVQPDDIDVVGEGQEAQVHISAFSNRDLPAMTGAVAVVSADSLVDERTGGAYYTALVRLPPSELDKLEGLQLLPGMPAEVLINTGSRSLLDYMLNPLTRTFRRAMRES